MLKGASFNEVVVISVFTLYCIDASKSNISKDNSVCKSIILFPTLQINIACGFILLVYFHKNRLTRARLSFQNLKPT